MKKFSEIEYVRPDMEAEQEKVRAYTKALKEAKSYEELRGLFMEEKTREDAWATMAEVAQVRYTVDTRDSFYEGEVQFWNETIPAIHLLIQKAEKVILESPFIKEFAEEFGEFFVKNMEVGQKLADDCIVEDLIEEANLTQQYSKITANASTEFKGETCNFYGLLKAMQSTDRQMRKEAMTAWGDLYEEISGELDALYDKMVPLRDKIAKKLGFSSYIEFIYLSYGRYDYTAEDVAKFRAQVKEKIVPLCLELRKEQEKRLRVDRLHYYDEELIFPEGNAVPEGTTEELVAKAQKMYHELSKETGEFFDFMVEHELFELYAQPGLHEKPEQLGKRGGAYYSDAACECISAIYNDRHLRMTVSTENKGALPCLAPDSIVEVSSLISARGAEPIAWGEMPPAARGWLQLMKAMEECVIEAAITGDYGLALEAFTMNPLIESGKEGKRVLDELLVAHEKYLPQFAEKIQELKAAGVETDDEVVRELLRKGL